LRPKQNGSQAHFYSIVTKNTRDQEFAANRQLFLTEQGYQYIIREWQTGAPDEGAGKEMA
jgi:DNA excision repair protein ERCC-3